MAVAVKKYNPGFLSDDEIIESFCVRTSELESILESLRESTRSSNPHTLVIGPRGSGKTHLLLRVAAEVRRDENLAWLFPVVFAEESYEVGTCGEFWLEGLGHLVEQAPADEQDNLRLTYNELRTVRDDRALAERCIGTLLDFADRHKQRLLLLVENLNMLFSDIGDPEVGWQLRKTLQTEPRIIVLGSATSRFDEIDSPERALYDLFRVITLRPLDTKECEALWKTVSGQPPTTGAVRPLEILTGGNPRLLAIIARFGSDQAFHELMGNLLDLVDEHTEYFKSHLEALPPQERRVYLALARLWKPSTAREIADLARLDTSKCSALLGRLVQRGAVVVEGGTPRRREYYLTERLYNIYYLMRRGQGADRFVRALIDFMVCLYSPAELGEIIERIFEQSSPSDLLRRLFMEQMGDVLIDRALEFADMGMENEAIDICDQIIKRLGSDQSQPIDLNVALALGHKCGLLFTTGRRNEAIADCDDLVNRFEKRTHPRFRVILAGASRIKAATLIDRGDTASALNTLDQALARIGKLESAYLRLLAAKMVSDKGWALIESNQPTEAIAAFDQVVNQFGTVEEPGVAQAVADAITFKVVVLDSIGQSISEDELSLLLRCFDRSEQLSSGSIEALVRVSVRIGPARTLELIQQSPAAQLLLPLIAALQQELGQQTQVAKEVEEVAQDIRHKLVELRDRLLSGNSIRAPH